MVVGGQHPILGTEDFFSAYPDIDVGPVVKAFPDIEVGGVIKITPGAFERGHGEGDEFDVIVGIGTPNTKGMRIAESTANTRRLDALGEINGHLSLRVIEASLSTLTCLVTDKSTGPTPP